MVGADITFMPGDKLPDIYRKALQEAGATVEPRDPFGKIMTEQRRKLIELASRASRHERFIENFYREPFNRITNNFLDVTGLTYSWSLSYEYSTDLQLHVTLDTIKQIVPLIKLMVAEGFRIIQAPTKGGTETTKVWKLMPRTVEHDHPDLVKLVIFASAKRCTRVQVGTEMVEKPIFEVHCDWSEDQPDLPEGKDDLPF